MNLKTLLLLAAAAIGANALTAETPVYLDESKPISTTPSRA